MIDGKVQIVISERVRRHRIRVSVAALAYEYNYRSVMSDTAYDTLANIVHKHINVATGNHRLDRFFQRHFTPHTGLWIHRHPNILGLINIYARYYHNRRRQ